MEILRKKGHWLVEPREWDQACFNTGLGGGELARRRLGTTTGMDQTNRLALASRESPGVTHGDPWSFTVHRRRAFALVHQPCATRWQTAWSHLARVIPWSHTSDIGVRDCSVLSINNHRFVIFHRCRNVGVLTSVGVSKWCANCKSDASIY